MLDKECSRPKEQAHDQRIVGANRPVSEGFATDGPSVIHSGRSFLFIAPPVRCLDIVRMVISPSPSHTFGISVVWHDVVIVRELFVADGAYPVLLNDLPVQEFPHFCR
jgi:hypothetical protein